MADLVTARIRVVEDGPYLVSGGPKLAGRQAMESSHGEPLAWEAVDPADAPLTDSETMLSVVADNPPASRSAMARTTSRISKARSRPSANLGPLAARARREAA